MLPHAWDMLLFSPTGQRAADLVADLAGEILVGPLLIWLPPRSVVSVRLPDAYPWHKPTIRLRWADHFLEVYTNNSARKTDQIEQNF